MKNSKLRKNRVTRRRYKGGSFCQKPMNNSNLGKYSIGKMLFNGVIFEFVENGVVNPDYIVKKVEYPLEDDKNTLSEEDLKAIYLELELEHIITKKAGEIGVGPKIIFSTVCKNDDGVPTSYMIMENIKGSDFKYKGKKGMPNIKAPPTEDEMKQVKELFTVLYDNGIDMYDRHYGNFMRGTTVTSPDHRVWIIDYDKARYTPGIPIPEEKRVYRFTAI